VSKSVIKATGSKLASGVDEGFGEVDYDSPDYAMREYLKRNTWKFAVAKNYNDCVRLSNLLVRPDGSLRPWNEYKREALFVVGVSNRHLKTEYDTAVAGAQMSRLWQEIQRDKHVFPYAQFDVVRDGGTSDICAPLDGVICTVDDPRLAYFFPPNHFNCRTTVRRLRRGVPTNTSAWESVKIPNDWKNNAGVTGEIFTKENKHIANTPEIITVKASRSVVMAHAEQNYIGKTLYSNSGEKITVSKKGIKHFLNQSHDDILSKNLLGLKLDEVLKQATFIKSAADHKGRNFNYHYYQVRGIEKMYVVIRELRDTGEKQFYSVVQAIK